MQLTINKKEVIEVPKNQYKINVEFMFGDGDGSSTEEVLINDSNVEEIERFIKCLLMCNAAYPNGRGGGSDYNYDDVPDYDRYFSEDCDEETESEIYCEHPYDSNCDSQSTFHGFSITHFDENGIEREVTYSISKTEKQELTKKLRKSGFKGNIR